MFVWDVACSAKHLHDIPTVVRRSDTAGYIMMIWKSEWENTGTCESGIGTFADLSCLSLMNHDEPVLARLTVPEVETWAWTAWPKRSCGLLAPTFVPPFAKWFQVLVQTLNHHRITHHRVVASWCFNCWSVFTSSTTCRDAAADIIWPQHLPTCLPACLLCLCMCVCGRVSLSLSLSALHPSTLPRTNPSVSSSLPSITSTLHEWPSWPILLVLRDSTRTRTTN